jgi:UDP-N-acetylmuramyl pentapeptide phosphotransferase/UDP-N-acetylglucosamine-1-phosphate transferase
VPLEWQALAPVLLTATALATAALILALRPLLARYALARPNARSSHRTPTPQGGGMAVVAVTIAATAVCASFYPWLAQVGSLTVVLVAAVLLAVVGAADDILVLRAAPRFGCQLASAVAVVVVLPDGVQMLPAVPAVVEHALLVLAIVWFVNLVNFMDGIDWITVAEVLPITAGIAVIAILGEAPPLAFVVAIALAGATLGFAPFNRPVARLFLGDVGSLPIGLLIAWLLILVAASGHLVAAVLLPLYYVADATITLGRRLARRERFWEAHRTHFYQRATDRGFSVSAIVARVFGVNVILMGLAITTVVERSAYVQSACALGGTSVVAVLLAMFHMGRARCAS